MRGLTGLTLVLAGAAAAVYGYYPDADERREALTSALAVFTSEPSKPAAATADIPLVVVDPQRRAFSPQAPLFQQIPSGAATAGASQKSIADPGATVASPSLASRVLPGAATAAVSPRRGQDAVVADAAPVPVVVQPAERPTALPRAPALAGNSNSEEATRDLTRNLQRELKRVGCYDGEISGSWNTASRRAMKSFTDRVNATLPVDEPDYILLTLVQGHGAQACGAQCPGDQVLAKDGKCLPRAIVAQAEKKGLKRAQANAATTKTAAAKPADKPADRPAARTAEVGRAIELWSKTSPEAAVAPQPRTVTAEGWKTAVVTAELPPAAAPVTQPIAAPAPLPGRMAIGGPIKPAAELAAVEAPAPASVAAVDPSAIAGDKAAARRLPKNVVNDPRAAPRPRRSRASDSGSAGTPVRAQPSKSARVRAMHYNLFSNPNRTTN